MLTASILENEIHRLEGVAHTPRDISFCGQAVALNQPFCIPNTRNDPDFSNNPLVTGPPGIRSYLGWPLEITSDFAGGYCASAYLGTWAHALWVSKV